MTPEAEAALIAAAVATCHAEREVSLTAGRSGAVLVCGLAQGHDGLLHWDSVDNTVWAATQPGMTREQAAEAVRRLVTP